MFTIEMYEMTSLFKSRLSCWIEILGSRLTGKFTNWLSLGLSGNSRQKLSTEETDLLNGENMLDKLHSTDSWRRIRLQSYCIYEGAVVTVENRYLWGGIMPPPLDLKLDFILLLEQLLSKLKSQICPRC